MQNKCLITLLYRKNNNQNQLLMYVFRLTLKDSFHNQKLIKRQYKHKNLMKLNQIIRHNLKKILFTN